MSHAATSDISDEVRDWARRRRRDLLDREGEHSLEVGLMKPMGSQSFPALLGALSAAIRARRRGARCTPSSSDS